MPKKSFPRTTKKTGILNVVHHQSSSAPTTKSSADKVITDKILRKESTTSNKPKPTAVDRDRIIPKVPEELSYFQYLDAAEMISVLTNVNKSGLTLLESAAIYGVQTGLLEDIYAKVSLPDLLSLIADAIYRLVHISEKILLNLKDNVLDCGRLVRLLNDEQRITVLKLEVPIKEVEGDYSLAHHIVNHRCHRIFQSVCNEFKHSDYMAALLSAHYRRDYPVNVLSFAASIGNLETVQYAYQKVDAEKFLVLLASPGWRGYTSIHNAIYHGQAVTDILALLPMAERGQLLLFKDDEQLPILSYCMKYNKKEYFDAILKLYKGKYSELISIVTYDETLELSILQFAIRQEDNTYLQKLLKATFSPWKATEFQIILKSMFSSKNTGYGDKIKEQFGEFVKHVQKELGSFSFIFPKPL